MSYTMRSCPPSSSFAAIGWPMFPTPKYPTFIAALRRVAIGLVEAATDRPRLHGGRFPYMAWERRLFRASTPPPPPPFRLYARDSSQRQSHRASETTGWRHTLQLKAAELR